MVISLRGGTSPAREPRDSASAYGLAPSLGKPRTPTSLHQGLTPLAWTLTRRQDGKPKDAYSNIRGFKACPRVKYNGARYWQILPCITDIESLPKCDSCLLAETYQLARNVMAAAINPVTLEADRNGLALLLYDGRNPEFTKGGSADLVYKDFSKHLKMSHEGVSILRRATWQSILQQLFDHGGYGDLIEFVRTKYGITPAP